MIACKQGLKLTFKSSNKVGQAGYLIHLPDTCPKNSLSETKWFVICVCDAVVCNCEWIWTDVIFVYYRTGNFYFYDWNNYN